MSSRRPRKKADASGDGVCVYAGYGAFAQHGARRRDRSVEIDAAAAILDHHRFKAVPVRVLGRVADAEIESQAGEEDAEAVAVHGFNRRSEGDRARPLGRGESADFYRDGHTAKDGKLPMNTQGGGMSYTHTGMYGMFAIQEAVRQLRGEAVVQIPDVKTSFVQGFGFFFGATASLILSNEP